MRSKHTTRAGSWPALTSALVAFILPAMAHAQTVLLHSDPKPNASIVVAPAQISLGFSQPIVASKSHVSVFLNGQVMDKNDLHSSPDPRFVLEGLYPLLPGTYVVNYHVIDAGNHEVSGIYSFKVVTPFH